MVWLVVLKYVLNFIVLIFCCYKVLVRFSSKTTKKAALLNENWFPQPIEKLGCFLEVVVEVLPLDREKSLYGQCKYKALQRWHLSHIRFPLGENGGCTLGILSPCDGHLQDGIIG